MKPFFQKGHLSKYTASYTNTTFLPSFTVRVSAHGVVVRGLEMHLHLHLCSKWPESAPDHLQKGLKDRITACPQCVLRAFIFVL